MRRATRLETIGWIGIFCAGLPASIHAAKKPETDPRVRPSIRRALGVLQKGAANYPRHRKCFSCHHQTLPLLAMQSAAAVGFDLDRKLVTSQTAFTRKSFRGRIDRLKNGTGIGGRAATVTYALWMLSLAKEKPDDLGAAMVMYLLKTQRRDGSWKPPSNRPPLEVSSITCTVLAIDGLKEFAAKEQSAEVAASIDKAETWLSRAKPRDNEDRMMLLWYRHRYAGDAPGTDKLRQQILARQNKDGGWSQKAGMDSDAYATGQNLYMLRESGVAANDPAIKQAVAFLLKTQKDNGSWFVKTRSRPVQVFFDNGDPHGKSQFISISATAWATAGLAKTLPQSKTTKPQP